MVSGKYEGHENEINCVAAIVGPTGVGKSSTAVEVALRLGGEIISCDSMQIYKGMDIGTAKISLPERKGVPHHMIDVVSPDVPFTVADYQKMVRQLINEINCRGNLPILVGGTGLYYQVVVDDYNLYPAAGDAVVRSRLQHEASQLGNHTMHERLSIVDPAAACRINPNDQKRIIRALETIETTGQLFSDLQTRNPDKYCLSAIGLTMPRSNLYERLESRVDDMITKGFVNEVEVLLGMGFTENLNSMKALGYAQIIKYLQGVLEWEECKQQIKRETRRYAKRQLTWFRKDHRINWIDVSEYSNAEGLVATICERFSRTIIGSVE